MEQNQFQNKSEDYNGSMQIDNDTIFSMLMKLNESVSGMSASIESLAEKIDKIQDQTDEIDKMQDQTDKQISQLQDQIDNVSDVAKDADNKVNRIQEKATSKLSLVELIWIPVLASIIPTILPHIHIH